MIFCHLRMLLKLSSTLCKSLHLVPTFLTAFQVVNIIKATTHWILIFDYRDLMLSTFSIPWDVEASSPQNVSCNILVSVSFNDDKKQLFILIHTFSVFSCKTLDLSFVLLNSLRLKRSPTPLVKHFHSWI